MMTLTPSSTPDVLPLKFPSGLRLTPEQFELFAPRTVRRSGSETSGRNSELLFQLQQYAKASGRWKVFESSGGFRLPDSSVVSPDASLVRLDRWRALSTEERRRFAPLCPDLVVKLASPSDEGSRGVRALREKMAAYQRNGARLGWLLLPEERAVEVWSSARDPQRLDNPAVLSASPEFPGLTLQLAEIWSV